MPAVATQTRRDHGRARAGKAAPALDLMRAPFLGALLRHPRIRLALQLPMLALAAVLVLHGLFGPALAPKNLATVVTWVHYRGLLVLALLAVGNLFCMGCPLLLPRELIRKFVQPVRRLPRALRNKWLSIGLFVGVLFSYELFDLWSSPAWTAALILCYFASATLVDAFFERASFCKYLCPVGQFNFAASTLSPLEVKVRDHGVCGTCRTKDCIRGRRDPEQPARVTRRGCELDLYLPHKVGNLDCTFCLDCVHACPHDNVALATRVPGEELATDPLRSGIGRLSKRPDLSVLVVVFAFGALLNAFGMVSPVYAFQSWLAERMGTTSEAAVLGVLFTLGLVVEPLVLLGLAGSIALRLGRSERGLLQHTARFAFTLAPIGMGVWAAHYSFHFLTGLWTFVPVAQAAAADLGVAFLGKPDWGRGGLTDAWVQPIELGLLLLGLAGSVAVTVRMAREEFRSSPARGAAPWIALHVLMFVAAVWLLAQPMEMRGTFL